ncbi:MULTISPECIES: RagB/SusD family nutrient uptake outer membrane protein [Aquimarina]|uniref:RagB/SusD family nutrient uptake outer membrane protein n=1 Tax=Aquimarina algiphila TaxID=2047982 RepID=A0A554VN96_9FLAO|nr:MULTISPECIES: RagB/SusD family nutrient uptake outer membrane protein [Aquimarina]TSE09835.1 RagB/SusD family nutrient uptake outer membrane protein [Aquimarina algiphila]
MIQYNKIKVFLILCFISLLTISCDKDVLDIENPNAVTEATFWKTPQDFDAALIATYGALQFQAISGAGIPLEMVRGDEAGSEDFYIPWFRLSNLNVNDGDAHVVNKWSALYIGVFRANQILDQLEVNSDVFPTQEEAILVEAQVRFLRAYFYFEIAHSYGGGVIRTSVPNTNEELSIPFSSIEEITDQVILPDLLFAKANLPQSWPDNEEGRVTWGAATSLLGKSYLYSKEWSQAAGEFREVIDAGIYSLAPNNLDNFSHEEGFNVESIFEVPFSVEFNPGGNGIVVDNYPGVAGSETADVALSTGHLRFGGFNTILPTYYMHELFVRDEIDPSNPINDGNIQSKRMGASIVPIDGDGLYYGLPIGSRPGWVFGQSSYVKKYSNWYHLEQEDGNRRSEINYRVIRLADVYLMYAEAVLEANGDFDTAIDFIDRVRTRAGVITLRQYITDDGGIPEFHISEQVASRPRSFAVASVESVRTHIRRVERPLELCFEGFRWKDLVRWGIAGSVLNELAQDELWRTQNQSGILDVIADPNVPGSGAGVAPLFIREKVRPDFRTPSENYNPQIHDYLPVPAIELQTNDQIGG